MFKDRKVKRTVTETVSEYYAEKGDIITIPGKTGLWVVEDAKMTGGGRAHNDSYPDAWHVWARLLTYENAQATAPTYDPNAPEIKFTQHTNSFNTVIDGVAPAGRMRPTFEFEGWGVDWED